MPKITDKNFIPLLITNALIVVSIVITILTDYALNTKHYFGITLILISTILFFYNKKIYAIVFGISLLIGLFSLIDIFYASFNIEIGPLKFNPLFLVLLILYLTLNRSMLDQLLPEKNVR